MITITNHQIINRYNPTTKDKILCVGWDTDRSERLVTETMVELMKKYSLTFDEVDEIVYGTSLDNYLEHITGLYSDFKYTIFDEYFVDTEFTPNTEQNNLKQENDKLKKELKATQEELKAFKKLVELLYTK